MLSRCKPYLKSGGVLQLSFMRLPCELCFKLLYHAHKCAQRHTATVLRAFFCRVTYRVHSNRMVLANAAMTRPMVSTEQKKRLTVKPGDVGARPALCWVAGASLPRTVRNRSPRKIVRPVRSPGSPHQEEATNPVTGKRALGPWLGPFASSPATSGCPSGASPTEGLLPPTMYVDTRGVMHLGLDTQQHQKLARLLQQAQEEAGMFSSSSAALDAAAAAATAKMAAEELAMRRRQARAMQARALDGATAAQRTPAARSVVRRMHQINQPRRMN